jgi:hypothetical protein
MNESGEIVGLIDRPTGMMDLMRIHDQLRGSPIIPYGEIKPAANAAPATLDDLRARGELIAPVTGDVHNLSGGFAVGINRGPTVAPSDQRTEFSLAEKGFTLLPQVRLLGRALRHGAVVRRESHLAAECEHQHVADQPVGDLELGRHLGILSS